MNFDYLEISTFTSKDKVLLGDLKPISCNTYGWENYSITYRNNNEMKVRYNNNTNQLKVEGSLPYFAEGQNFSNDINLMKDSIQIISDTINVNLFQSKIECFESGITFESPVNVNYIFNSHYKIKGMNKSLFKHGLQFDSPICKVKLYNAGKRLKTILSKEKRIELASSYNYNPNKEYIRIENHYKRPQQYFTKNEIKVNELFKEDFILNCKLELMNTYQKIEKEGSIIFPENKRDCTLPVIELIALKELGLRYGFNPEEYLKQKIKTIPESILTKEDKKNRKKSLKNLMNKITNSEVSSFDISNELKEALKLESS
jgi:hypothetical protein